MAKKSGRACCFVVLMLLFAAAAMQAQSTNAEITGQVNDPTKAVVTQASVTAVNSRTNVRYATATNQSGIYVITALPPGEYRIEVEKKGFRSIVKPEVVLHVQDRLEINFEIAVGSTSETVTVTGGAPLVNTESATVSTVIDSQFVKSLPLNGRSFTALLTLAPGVVPAGTDAHQFNVNGQRGQSNAFSVDGVSANIQGASAPAAVGVYGLGNTVGLTVSGTTQSLATIDELEEFTVQTSAFGAENGRQSGGQIAFATKSGTDQFHGSVYEYFRNEKLDANNWFSNRTGTARAPLRQNDAGGTFGGPIWKGKTFFFAALEYDPLRQPSVSNNTVPTQAYRNSVAAAVKSYVDLPPLPNSTIAADGRSGIYILNGSTQSFTDAATLKIDQHFGHGVTMFGRYHRTPSRASGIGITNSNNQYTNTQTMTYGATYTIRPSVVSDFRLNYSRNASGGIQSWRVRDGVSPLADSAILPPGRSSKDSQVAIQINESNFTTFIGNLGPTQTSIGHQWQATENVSFVVGKHKFDAGVDWRTIHANIPAGAPATGRLGITNGLTAAAQDSQTTGSPAFEALVHWTSLYLSDSWKVMPRLSLDLGLRWELEPPPSTISGPTPFAAANFDPNNPSVATLAPNGTPLWETRYGNFAPRVGAAYHLFSKPGRDTVVRGSFGLFYDMGLGNPIAPFTSTPFNFSGPTITGTYPTILSNPSLQPTRNVVAPYSRLTLFDPHMELPYTMNWTFGLQQALGHNQALTANYVGNRGRRLLMTVSQGFPANPIVTANGSINQTSNQSKSWYDSLQLQLNRRLGHGLQAVVNYTWAHSIDTASEDVPVGPVTTLPGKFFNVNVNKASSSFDVRHAFTTAVTYSIPAPSDNRVLKAVMGGWSIDPMVRAYSAKPVNVTYTVIQANQPNLTMYPSRVAGQPLWLSAPTLPRGKQLNSAAFNWPIQSGTQFVQGDAGRNAVRGFPVTQFDFAVRRDFKVTERLGLQFSTEIFNIFNHPNFTDPFGNLGTVINGTISRTSATIFGTSQQMLSSGSPFAAANALPIYAFGGQRDIQLALKLTF